MLPLKFARAYVFAIVLGVNNAWP